MGTLPSKVGELWKNNGSTWAVVARTICLKTQLFVVAFLDIIGQKNGYKIIQRVFDLFFLSRSCCSRSSSCKVSSSTFNFCENAVGCVLTTRRHDSQRAWPVGGRAEGLDKKIWDSGLGSRSTDQRKEHAQQRGSQNFHVSGRFWSLRAVHSHRLQVLSSHPLGGNVAAVGDSPAEGQGLPSAAESGADGPLWAQRGPTGEAAGLDTWTSKDNSTLQEQTRAYLLICFFFSICKQVQLDDTKKAREDAYDKYVASRSAAIISPTEWLLVGSSFKQRYFYLY